MKQLFFLLLLLLAFFASCGGDRRAEALLASADSLADVDADSARRLLGSLRDEMESSSRSVRNHYALLCIKADDKANIRQTSDSAILRLVDYYEHGGDERLLPVAYYYAGRTYRALNDAPQALDYLQKAAEAGERIMPNAKLLGKIYSQMGYLLSYQSIYQEALINHKKSYQISKNNKDTLVIIYNLRDIGGAYWDLEQLDSALFYYKKAEALALKQNNMRMFAGINSQIASFYLQMNNMKEAEKALRASEIYVNPINASSDLSIHACYYSMVGKKDSAYLCYKELLSKGNVYARCEAYSWLARYYLANRNIGKAIDYLAMYDLYVDSVKRITASEDIAKAYTMYNYKVREKENYELKLEKKVSNIKLALLGLTCIVLMLIVSFLLVRKNLKAQLRKFKKERLKRIEAESIDENKLKENENRIKDSDIYRLVQGKLNSSSERQSSLTDVEWITLGETLNSIYSGFTKKLQDLCEMSEHEYHVCLLIKLGITPTNIAKLTHHSKEAITSVRRRLYYKAFGEKASPSEWDKIIRSL